MIPFKFLRPITYDDLNFYAQIEYNQGWCAARAGERIDQSPYDEEFRGNWLFGWESYHRYLEVPIELTFNIPEDDE